MLKKTLMVIIIESAGGSVMPIYEFSCKKCDNQFEYLVFKDGEIVNCPDCGNKKVKKLMSACNFKDSKGSFSSSSGSDCSSCSSNNCSSCGH